MTLRLEQIALDCGDPTALGRFWSELLGGEATDEVDGDVVVRFGGGELLLMVDPNRKSVKNRLHLDLRPDNQGAEVARAERLGATRIDLGQGDVSWVVLADPEGNEFCILSDDPALDAGST